MIVGGENETQTREGKMKTTDKPRYCVRLWSIPDQRGQTLLETDDLNEACNLCDAAYEPYAQKHTEVIDTQDRYRATVYNRPLTVRRKRVKKSRQ